MHVMVRGELTTHLNNRKCSANFVMSDEAVQEIKGYLNSKVAYLNPTGGLKYGANNHIVSLVLHNFTNGLEMA